MAAIGLGAAAAQLGVAQTQPYGCLGVELDAVTQCDFCGVFAAVGVQVTRRGLGLRAVRSAVDVAGASPVVGLQGREFVYLTLAQPRERDIVLQSPIELGPSIQFARRR